MFIRIEIGHIYFYEANPRILKRSLRSRREVAVASTDSDDEISLARDDVGPRCAGYAHCAELLGMIERQRSLASLRLADWNACGRGKFRQRRGCLGIQHTASGDDQGFLGLDDPSCSFDKQSFIAAGSGDDPHALVQKFFRKIV